MAVDDLVIALVVVAEQVIVGGRPFVARVIVAAQSDRLLHDFVEDLYVLDELGEDAEAAFRRLVEKNVGRLGVTDGDHPDLIGLDLEDALDGALQGMLQRDDTVRLQAERLDGLDIERIGQIRSPQLDQPELLFDVALRLWHGAAPIAGNQADWEACCAGNATGS